MRQPFLGKLEWIKEDLERIYGKPKKPKKKKSKLQEDTLALARCCRCGAYISAYRGVFTKEGFYCETCWENRGRYYD